MSGRSARGASSRVQTALEWNRIASEAPRSEVAPCVLCGAELRFSIGDYGQTLEICTSRSCPGRVPHKPRPDPSAVKKPYVPKKRRSTVQEET